jgi:hypothetical protein
VIEDWTWPAAAAALALVVVLLVVAQVRGRSRHRRDLAASRAEVEALRAQVERVERRLAAPPTPEPRETTEYHITDLGRTLDGTASPRPARPEAGPVTDRALFADLVLRETVVRAASVAYGVRRALAPETRNRIRFEVRREIRRARKQRRADLKAARRDWEARQRAAVDDEDAA